MNPVESKLKVLQILYAALMGGALVFAGVALVVATGAAQPAQQQATVEVMTLRIVWVALFVSMVIALVVLRMVMPRTAAKQFGTDGTPETYLNPYFIMTIMTAAFLEGTSLYGGTTLLIGREIADVALALVPLAIMLPLFPTRRGFEKFMERATGSPRAEGLTAPVRDYREYR